MLSRPASDEYLDYYGKYVALVPDGDVRDHMRTQLAETIALLSGVSGPYRYLPRSVHQFPTPPQLLQTMQSIGFKDVSWTPYSFGIAGLYRAVKPNPAG